MKDSFGRTIDYLRLSITDRCNLRCIYCMPGGVELMPHNDILKFEEVLKLCKIMAALGIRKIKVTGGEPLVRQGAAGLISGLKSLPGIENVTMTSNGVLLGDYIDALVSAGLDALNISLDAVDEAVFRRITGGDGPGRIFAAIDRARDLGLPIKINCVPLWGPVRGPVRGEPLRGINEGDITKLAALAKDGAMTVRFIELMPLGAASVLQPVPADEVIALLEKEYGPLSPAQIKPGNGPAVYYTLPDFKGYIGFISALSRQFCDTCNRLRLSAAGFLRPCLSSGMGLDLRALLRGGVSDNEIGRAIRELISRKPACHNFGSPRDQGRQEMFRIGG